MIAFTLGDVKTAPGVSIRVDNQAIAGGEAIKSRYAGTVAASDYRWFLIGRAELPDDRLFYWQRRILDHFRRLASEGKITPEVYALSQELAYCGLLFLPYWRGTSQDGHDATVALWERLGLLSLRNEYVAEAMGHTKEALEKARAKTEFYEVAYKIVSTMSVTENLKKLRELGARLVSVQQSVREMENQANATLPPAFAAEFIDGLSPIKGTFADADAAIKDVGITPQEAGLGAYTAAIAIGLSILVIILGVYVYRAERAAALEKKMLQTATDVWGEEELALVEQRFEAANNDLVDQFMAGTISEAELLKRGKALELQKKQALNDTKAKIIQKKKEIAEIKTGGPLADLGEIAKYGAWAIGLGLAAYLTMGASKLLTKGK